LDKKWIFWVWKCGTVKATNVYWDNEGLDHVIKRVGPPLGGGISWKSTSLPPPAAVGLTVTDAKVRFRELERRNPDQACSASGIEPATTLTPRMSPA
jgi:hypothetical protein